MSEKPLFRKEAIQHVTTPDQLTDYLRVTNPSVWIVLAVVILILAGVFAWATVGTLESQIESNIQVQDGVAELYTVGTKPIEFKEGMTVRIQGTDEEHLIEKVTLDEDGWLVGYFRTELPDGFYNGRIIAETIKPITFLLESR